MASEPFVSIVVPTTGRVGHLLGMVRSTTQLDYPRDRFELLLLGDSHTRLLGQAEALARDSRAEAACLDRGDADWVHWCPALRCAPREIISER